ncbi:hypothetical protein [Halobacillus campisalis]|uniref:Uncharacterized protein n=1 Tax=Halobacillus campisalis TaxID=435909 RepID=A0ABW2K4P0_9BACI|nr:hypothetical protein [Halobacillus campisalis]
MKALIPSILLLVLLIGASTTGETEYTKDPGDPGMGSIKGSFYVTLSI